MKLEAKPSPFSKALAHENDPLADHLLRVARRAEALVTGCDAEIRQAAILAGLFHDSGKATNYFQDYLAGRTKKSQLTSHSAVSATLFWALSSALKFDNLSTAYRIRLSAFLAILRHHGYLRAPWHEELQNLRLDAHSTSTISDQLSMIDLAGIAKWVAEKINGYGLMLEKKLPDQVDEVLNLLHKGSTIAPPLRDAYTELSASVNFLTAFGALLSEDRLDAALIGNEMQRVMLPTRLVEDFVYKRFGECHNDLDSLRRDISDKVCEQILANYDQSHFTLTAPTGSGKTLAALRMALHLRSELASSTWKQPRIIYCLPFTSIIDQTHQVFKDVLEMQGFSGQDVLLKHHHLTEAFYRTKDDNEYPAEGAGQLLTESWQSEIVVTTFHQLLNSFLSPENRNIKRTSQIAGAIVLLDEVQAVPLEYWDSISALFEAVAERTGARFILLTATQPLIYEPDRSIELLPDHERYFRTLSRTRLHCKHNELISEEVLASQVVTAIKAIPEQSALIVLNRRATVGRLYKMLEKQIDHVFALSTYLTPSDRKVRIRQIHERLVAGKPCVVVSTQLVEAGVDLSFPIIFRDLSPLDCIIQSAGRCNRHGEWQTGNVHLVNLKSKQGCQWHKVYDAPLVEATTDVLGENPVYEEHEFISLAKRYFRACKNRQQQNRVDELLIHGKFDELPTRFQLIREGLPTKSLFVIRNDEDRALWARYLELIDQPAMIREQYFRAFKANFYERVIQVFGTNEEGIRPLNVGPETYDSMLGFVGFPKEKEDAGAVIL
ncbi:MAG: CRISPR-associated helicase Cas3' [Thermoleophilia bacterium]|nr:CRISPR-associated helicase Cas3' [Thermoleophilia bacterium]